MEDSLELLERRHNELTRMMADPEIAVDHEKMRDLAQEQSDLSPSVDGYRELKAIRVELENTREMLNELEDEEMIEMAREEIAELEERETTLEEHLRRLLLPTDPNDKRNVIMEIRAGAGGDESSLFASDLYRMYSRYAEQNNWKMEIISENRTGVGGYKEVVVQIDGRGAFSKLKYESGVHRVQRVPETESSGRIHTSTATVAVLPEIDDVEVHINPEDVKMEVYRSSGPGGQHMQKNSTAVRITHLPTGMVVSCEKERSQLQNRLRAMVVLRSRLYAIEEEKRILQLEKERQSQVGSGDRSEKIRTYNYPQNRVTDHRINLSTYRLEDFMEGALDDFLQALSDHDQTERLKAIGLDR